MSSGRDKQLVAANEERHRVFDHAQLTMSVVDIRQARRVQPASSQQNFRNIRPEKR